jgi:hypothetical protein
MPPPNSDPANIAECHDAPKGPDAVMNTVPRVSVRERAHLTLAQAPNPRQQPDPLAPTDVFIIGGRSFAMERLLSLIGAEPTGPSIAQVRWRSLRVDDVSMPSPGVWAVLDVIDPADAQRCTLLARVSITVMAWRVRTEDEADVAVAARAAAQSAARRPLAPPWIS